MQVRTEGQNGMAIFSVQIVYGLHDAPTGGQTAVNKPYKAVKSHNSWPSINRKWRLCETQKGNKYIVTFQGDLSKYFIAVPLRQ